MMKDVIAEPYREALLPNFAEVKQATRDLGALATGISGSGPTIFSIAPDLQTATKLATYLENHYFTKTMKVLFMFVRSIMTARES